MKSVPESRALPGTVRIGSQFSDSIVPLLQDISVHPVTNESVSVSGGLISSVSASSVGIEQTKRVALALVLRSQQIGPT